MRAIPPFFSSETRIGTAIFVKPLAAIGPFVFGKQGNPRPHHHVITRRTGAASKGFYQLGRAHWLRLLRAEVAAIVDGRDQRGVLERAIADGIASLRSRLLNEDGGGSSGGGGGDVLVEPDDVVEWVLALETHPAFVDGLPLRRFEAFVLRVGSIPQCWSAMATTLESFYCTNCMMTEPPTAFRGFAALRSFVAFRQHEAIPRAAAKSVVLRGQGA